VDRDFFTVCFVAGLVPPAGFFTGAVRRVAFFA
jgi:hypothetical protein